MATIGKLYNTGKLSLLEGELNERLPLITDGLTHHFPFDGSTNAIYDIENANLNILSYNSHATTWQMKNNLANGTISTGTITTNDSATEAQALGYDLVVCDNFYWAVSSTFFNTLKTYADAGCVVWSTGNDTGVNNLILTITAIGSETTYHGHIYGIPTDIEVYLGPDTALSQVDNTSSDPASSITTMHEDCIALYWHDFVGESGIMGFLYLPNNDKGGSLFFDMYGYVTSFANNQVWLKHLLEWQLNNKRVSSLVTTDNYTTHRFSGVGVEASTTNIITNPHTYFGSDYRPYTAIAHGNEAVIVTDVPPAIEGIDVWRITDNALDTQNQRWNYKFDVVTESIWDVDVTFSVYMWIPEKFKDRCLSFSQSIYQNTTGVDWHSWQGWNATYNAWGAGSINSDARTPDLSKTNCWQKYSITGKALVANRYNDFGDTGTGSPDNKYITAYLRINVTEGVSGSSQPSPFFWYITAPQLEEKAYHTEFVDGSRSGNGELIISGLNIDTSSEDFTVSFKIDTNGLIGNSTGRKIELNNFGYFWRYYPTNTTNTVKFVWDWIASSRVYEDLNSSILFDTGYETITITYDANATTYGTIKFYRNGIYWEVDYGTSICTRGIISQIQILDMGMKIKNLSIFNKVLNDAQIYELANSGMSFRDAEHSNLITHEVRECPDLPSTYYTKYFPLGGDGNDKNNIISPDTETNTVYEDRSLWIGQSTTNLCSDYYSDWSNTGTHESYTDPVSRLDPLAPVYGFRQLTTGNSGLYYAREHPDSISTVYSGSVWVWIDAAGTETNVVYFREYRSADNGSLGTMLYKGEALNLSALPQRKWVELELENITTSSDSVNIGFSVYINNVGTTVYITKGQLEQKPFTTPFIFNGTRGNTYLEYADTNLTQEHGAICGWFEFNENARTWRGPANNNDYSMLFSTYGASEINKLNVRAHYTGSTSVWSVQTTNSVPNGTSTNVTISDGWHFICLAWNDSTGYSKFFIDANKEFDKASYLPDAYSSVLLIGNWGSTTPWGNMNQCVRDLIILDFYPGDTEIQDIYQKTMSASKDILRVNYEVEEV